MLVKIQEKLVAVAELLQQEVMQTLELVALAVMEHQIPYLEHL
jgi:hypothetical protein